MSEDIKTARTDSPCLRALVGADEEELPWVLQDLGAVAVETRDETTMDRAESGRALLIAGFEDAGTRDAAVAELARIIPAAEIEPVDVGDDGWSSGWRAFFKPVILETVRVITPWMEPPPGDGVTVVIDPGLAFGTGGHATTRLILEMLERRAAAGGLPGRVLDVGIGSGVLSIAAVMLGAGMAEGFDIDEESVQAVRDNAAANRVGDRVRAWADTPDRVVPDRVEGAWPLVLANIELRVFERHAADIAPLVAAGGEVILSGLLEDQVEACLGLWPGFELVERTAVDGWAALALRPRS